MGRCIAENILIHGTDHLDLKTWENWLIEKMNDKLIEYPTITRMIQDLKVSDNMSGKASERIAKSRQILCFQILPSAKAIERNINNEIYINYLVQSGFLVPE